MGNKRVQRHIGRCWSIIALICLIPVGVWAWGVLGLSGGTPTGECTASGTLVSCKVCDCAGNWGIQTDTNSTARQLVKNSSSITICQVDLLVKKFNGGTTCTCHLEIWDSGMTGQIGGDSDQFTVTSTSATWKEVAWSSGKPNPTADFFIVSVLVSCDAGNAGWCDDDDGNPDCYEDTNYDVTAGVVERNEDVAFTVYTE